MENYKPLSPESEKEILKFWEKNRVFQKLIAKNKNKPAWSFLDGPITANNPMGVHHAWGRTYKDLFQRYHAMKGEEQRFQNGFDCQGLWVEVEVEKELGFKTKKEIEEYGIEKFVKKCKERVQKYAEVQTEQSIRLGQWMDWENSYYTMSDENNYAIWHFLKKCHEKGYLYKGHDCVPWCPRCGTAISQHEILSEEYREIYHESVYLKLPIINSEFKNSFLLVWTTTPWTLPGNVAVAVNDKLEYGVFSNGRENLILLKDLATKILNQDFKLTKTLKGQDLLDLKYIGPFDDLEMVLGAREKNPETFHAVISDNNLVTCEEGTGLVHIAPGAGAEDFKLAKSKNLSVINLIDESAGYSPKLGEFSGQNAKKHPEIILEYLRNKDAGKYFYKVEKYQHRYPVCWRCKKELVWRVVDEWYISMDKLREPMTVITKQIKWQPNFGLARELDWLKNMEDWLISKKRYWGLALPIFECECGNFEVIGSKKELEEKAVSGFDKFAGHTPHRPWIDEVKIKCSKCNKPVSRVKDVGNPWLDAGIVPFSTMKYFDDYEFWQKWYPADFICESFPGQFKNWFYSLIAMSTVLENSKPFKNVLGFATVRDDKGEEMHKSKGNTIWFNEAVEKVGADAMRWLYSLADPFSNLNFGYKNINEAKKELIIFQNVVNFFETYAKIDGWQKNKNIQDSKNLLDKWILSKLNSTIENVSGYLDQFKPHKATQQINNLILDLSLWYLRRSRKRRNEEFYQTLFEVIFNINILLAPFLPYFSEANYQRLKSENDPVSVHLLDFRR